MNFYRAIASFVVLLTAVSWPAMVQPAHAQEGSIAISPASQGEIAAYLNKIRNTRPGALAISLDGIDTFYSWCADLMCSTSSYSNIALRGCQSISGAQCVILYFRNEQRMGTTVFANAGPGRHGSQQIFSNEFRRID